MTEPQRIRQRQDVPASDTWDLQSLFPTNAEWEQALKQLEQKIDGFIPFRGTLGDSANQLAACLKFDSECDRLSERVGTYTFLKTCEDQANAEYQAMQARYQNVAARLGQATSFIRPEILAIPSNQLSEMLAADSLTPYRLWLERVIRFKPHTLSDKEENLLAMQSEMSQAVGKVFRQLLDADMKFGMVTDEHGHDVELTNSTLIQFLNSSERRVRETAFRQYYAQFQAHENTLAATLAGSIHKDVYYARARNYPSSLDAALFPDNVPRQVYESLIVSVRSHLPTVHRYYDLRRRKMNLPDIHHYDTYVPILTNLKKHHTWSEATEVILSALAPLGTEYIEVLERGLQGRWCDRYPNQGKQSGAFSCGTFDADPYILMNFHSDVLNDVFTLAHEAGHSMHSYFSAHHQPFETYNYTIFVAEVASTFNEQLLSDHLLAQATSAQERAYLVNREIDDIRGTIIRQTMFAEFEKITHEMAEAGEPITLAAFRQTYRQLLESYFGPEFVLDNELSLESLRIPHFYRAFYVYKYATGMSAAIALCHRVRTGGPAELQDYLDFLRGGCSKDPLDLLRDAGVDMASPLPVNTALERFDKLVVELEELL